MASHKLSNGKKLVFMSSKVLPNKKMHIKLICIEDLFTKTENKYQFYIKKSGKINILLKFSVQNVIFKYSQAVT
jgi:hypothetical protein